MKLFKVLSLVVITATFSNLGALHASSKMAVGKQNQYTPEELYRLCETDPGKIASNEKLQDLVVHNIISHNTYLSDDQILAVIPNLVEKAIDSLLLSRLLVMFTKLSLSNNLVTAIKAKAETNDEAAYIHAKMLQLGKGIKKDEQQAHDKFALLAKKDHAEATMHLGHMHYKGWKKANGSKQVPDPEKAVELHQTAADRGNARAMSHLGFTHILGWTTAEGSKQEPDHEKAAKFLQNPVDKGDVDAIYALGWLYGVGWERADGSKQAPDPEKNVELYKKAADRGNARAMNNLGTMHKNGWKRADGSKQGPDLDKAVELYKKAADKGDVPAQAIMRNTVHLDSDLCLDPAIDFSLSNDNNKYAIELLGQLHLGQDMFSSSGLFLGSQNVPKVADAFGKVIADIEKLQTLLESFNSPGFLVTCLKSKVDGLSNSTSEYPMFKTFTIREEEYHQCFGRENVKAAGELLSFLEKMKKMQDNPSVIFLRGYFMRDDLPVKESDQKTTELSDDEFLAQLKTRCSQPKFEKTVSELALLLKIDKHLNPEASKESDDNLDNTEEETFFKVLNKMCDKFQKITEKVYEEISSQAGRIPNR